MPGQEKLVARVFITLAFGLQALTWGCVTDEYGSGGPVQVAADGDERGRRALHDLDDMGHDRRRRHSQGRVIGRGLHGVKGMNNPDRSTCDTPSSSSTPSCAGGGCAARAGETSTAATTPTPPATPVTPPTEKPVATATTTGTTPCTKGITASATASDAPACSTPKVAARTGTPTASAGKAGYVYECGLDGTCNIVSTRPKVMKDPGTPEPPKEQPEVVLGNFMRDNAIEKNKITLFKLGTNSCPGCVIQDKWLIPRLKDPAFAACIQVVSIGLGEKPENKSPEIKYFADMAEWYTQLDVKKMPTNYVVGKDGKVLQRTVGSQDTEKWVEDYVKNGCK